MTKNNRDWIGGDDEAEVISKSVGALHAAIWPMPHDNYRILLTHDFGTETTNIEHWKSIESAQRTAEEWFRL